MKELYERIVRDVESVTNEMTSICGEKLNIP
jgi:hypothetical protein